MTVGPKRGFPMTFWINPNRHGITGRVGRLYGWVTFRPLRAQLVVYPKGCR